MLLAKAQLCIAVSELFLAAVIGLVSCSCAWTGEILSCRRMERALIGLRIPFWLKIAVVFATALCIRAEGVQPCCPAVGLKAEGIQPGCVAIGIISEEAKAFKQRLCLLLILLLLPRRKLRGFWIWVGSVLPAQLYPGL